MWKTLEVEKFNWGALQSFILRNWISSTRKLYDISCPRSGKFTWRTSQCFISTKEKSLTGEL